MSLRGLLRGFSSQKSYPQIFSVNKRAVDHSGHFSFKPLLQDASGLFYEVHSASTTSQSSIVVAIKRWKLYSSEKGISRTWNKMEQLLHTPKTACVALGISRSTLYRLIAEGQIEVTRVRSLPRFTEASLKRFVERQLTQSREQAVGF
jgi:excisionase family DNA binding protein